VATVADVLTMEPRIEQVVFCCFDAVSLTRHVQALDEVCDHG